MSRNHKTPGEVVTEVFGGTRQLAKSLKLGVVTVYRWQPWPRHSPKFNLEGAIHQKHFRALLDLARSQGKQLSAEDLIRGR